MKIKSIRNFLIVSFLILVSVLNINANPQPQKKAALEEQLGKYIPLDAEFYNEQGQKS